jgi:hypothetical protein
VLYSTVIENGTNGVYCKINDAELFYYLRCVSLKSVIICSVEFILRKLGKFYVRSTSRPKFLVINIPLNCLVDEKLILISDFRNFPSVTRNIVS